MASAFCTLVELLRSKPVVVFLALATHYVLHNTEWDNSFDMVLRVWAIAFGAVAALTYMTDQRAATIATTAWVTGTVASLYFGILVTSILIHRGVFHRLRKVCQRAAIRALSFCFAVAFLC
jgi:hypothetical protein